jgi:hypothetical protein
LEYFMRPVFKRVDRFFAVRMALASVLLVLAGPSAADNYSTFVMMDNFAPAWTQSQNEMTMRIVDGRRKMAAEKNGSASKTNAQHRAGSSGQQLTKLVTLSYAANPQVTAYIKQKVMDEILASLQKKGKSSPQAMAEVRQLFDSTDINQVFAGQTARSKLPQNSMITAYTTLLVTGFSIRNDGRDASPEVTRAVYKQLQRVFSADAELENASPLAKQGLAEQIYWAAYLNVSDFRKLKDGKAGFNKAQLHASVRRSMMSVGIDPEKMILDAEGLNVRG